MNISSHQQSLLRYYNPSEPVIDPESLKGREREQQEALLLLLNGENLIVQGARRIGKTSFMYCLKQLCSLHKQHCTYLSFQRLSRYNVPAFAHLFQHQLSSLFEVPEEISTNASDLFDFLRQSGALLIESLEPDAHVIIFLDEFQLTEQFREDERHVLYNQLRDVIDERVSYPELRKFLFVLSTSQSLSELTTGISSTLASAFSKTFYLGRLPSQGCHELIRHPFADTFELQEQLVERLTYETGGHPYLVKQLLHDLLIQHHLSAPTVLQSIEDMFDAQIHAITTNSHHDHFLMLTNLLSEVELQILYEVDKYQKIGFLDLREAIFKFLKQYPQSVQPLPIRSSLDHLENIQILSRENDLFCFSCGIYQKWFSLFLEQYYISEALQRFRNLDPSETMVSRRQTTTHEEFDNLIFQALGYLKIVFEERGLWELAWKDWHQGARHHERYLQKMTAALLESYLGHDNVMIDREVESGRGPMDVKLSLNRDLAACLEIKKSTGDVYHGLEIELMTYMGSTLRLGFFVLFYVGGSTALATMSKKLEAITEKIKKNHPNKLIRTICIDCLPKTSASHRER